MHGIAELLRLVIISVHIGSVAAFWDLLWCFAEPSYHSLSVIIISKHNDVILLYMH